MSKGILDHSSEDAQASMSVVGRTVIIIGLLLGAVNFALEYGLDALPLSERWARQAGLAFFLFFVWLAVSSGVRAVDKLMPGIAVGWLFITGLGIGLWGQAVFSLARWAAPQFRGEATASLLSFIVPGLLPSLAASLLVAVLTAITLRVKSKLAATALRLLLFGLLALFIYLKM